MQSRSKTWLLASGLTCASTPRCGIMKILSTDNMVKPNGS